MTETVLSEVILKFPTSSETYNCLPTVMDEISRFYQWGFIFITNTKVQYSSCKSHYHPWRSYFIWLNPILTHPYLFVQLYSATWKMLGNTWVFTFDHLNETTHCVKFKTTWYTFQPLCKLISILWSLLDFWCTRKLGRLLRKCEKIQVECCICCK